jgi:hypothetical protein
MEKKEKRNILILTIIALIVIIYSIGRSFSQGEKAMSIVPISGLPLELHLFLLNAIWPLVGSIVFIVIFPLLLTPVFLKLKKIIWRKYDDSYVYLEEKEFNMKKFVKRTIYVFLLTFGLCATVVGRLDLTLFVSEASRGYWIDDIGMTLEYTPDAFQGLASLLYPLVIGIWAIGWILEDASLMHSKVPKENKKMLFEIEPVHLKYNAIIKGYAGITAILYFIGAFAFYVSMPEGALSQAFSLISFGVLSTFIFIPAYLLYWKLLRPMLIKYLRKGKKSIPMITARQLNE